MKFQSWFSKKWTVLTTETITQLVNENGGNMVAVAVLGVWKHHAHETGPHSPSDSSIDLKMIENRPEYLLPSIYSSTKTIKRCQCGWWFKKARLSIKLTFNSWVEGNQRVCTGKFSSWTPCLHDLSEMLLCIAHSRSHSFTSAVHLISRKHNTLVLSKERINRIQFGNSS